MRDNPAIDKVIEVYAGKFRRYHGEGWRQVLDVKTQYLNLRDGFRVIIGIFQSWLALGKIKPDIVFTRGGFVSVPVALAAKLRGIKYITHDSDSTPSLANRLIYRWAAVNAVAMPPENYPYPHNKTVQVGVPISHDYVPVSDAKVKSYRKALGIADFEMVICATGGGNGAKKLNDIIRDNTAYLLRKYPKLVLLHISGRNLDKDLELEYDKLIDQNNRRRVIVKDFVTDLYKYSGAADIVIARGGATNLAEFAVQGKACIIIPSKQLVWNIRNAEALAGQGAVISMSEDQAEQELRLASVIGKLLDDPKQRHELSNKFAQFANQNSTQDIVELIVRLAQASA